MARKKNETIAEPNGNLAEPTTPANANAEPAKVRKPRKPNEPKQYRLERQVDVTGPDSNEVVKAFADQSPGTTYPDADSARHVVITNELLGIFRVTRVVAGDTFESKLRASLV